MGTKEWSQVRLEAVGEKEGEYVCDRGGVHVSAGIAFQRVEAVTL